MIKTLIKHTIAETAINAMFQSLNKNFPVMTIPMFKLGQTYSKIEIHYFNPTIYGIKTEMHNTIYDCVIEVLHYSNAGPNAKQYAISVTTPYPIISRNLAEHKMDYHIESTYMIKIDHIINIK